MQLRHLQRQLLSRCTLRWYSVGAVQAKNTPEAIATSDAPGPPRLRRPLASSFGGINIQNVAAPTQKHHNRTNRPSRSSGSDDKSPDMRRKNQPERHRGVGKAGASPSLSGWGDGLVTATFSSRLKQHQKRMTTRSTSPPPDAQPWRQQREQQPKHTQRPQMHGHRRGQKEQQYGDAPRDPHAPRPRRTAKSTGAKKDTRAASAASHSTDAKPKASSMTRSSTFKLHPRASTPTPTAVKTSRKSKADQAAAAAATNTTTTSSSADRNARLTALSTTNLNALFRTRDAPIAGIPLALTSMSARVRSVLERSAGDYSRFLPRRVGVRKDASRLPALRTARHALAVQRDVSLDQRRVALHIIGGMTQPHRQVRA